MADRVASVIADVFGVPADSITDDASPDTIEQWDSMGHINLMLALESEFGLQLSPDDATNMLSVGLIKANLAQRGVTDFG